MRFTIQCLVVLSVLLSSCSQSPDPNDPEKPISESAFVGCGSDSDCKSDRICENAKCVAPANESSVSQKELRRTASIKALEAQLRCRENPEPGKAILALMDNGLLAKPTEWEDGVPTLTPIGEFRLFGHKVVSVSGFEDNNPKGRSAELFPRGPGTSPGYFISVVLDAKPKGVDYEEIRRAEDDYESPHSYKYEVWSNPNQTGISCNGHGF